ncbi:MAG TPA: hypothetical protein VL251_10710 [Thermomonas sp.]|nr:hypothetical protein [Thermomonas sp.]
MKLPAAITDNFTPHGSALIAVLLFVLGALLSGCHPVAAPAPAPAAAPAAPAVTAAALEAQDAVGDAAQDVREAAVAVVIPAALDAQQAVQDALPPPAPQVVGAQPAQPGVAPAAVALIVRQEIISPAYYTAKLQNFACPGERSGPTCGIGSDLGVHTPTRIRSDWSVHPQVDRLAQASGRVGFGACRAYRRANADIRTPFEMAQQVFATKVLPAYRDLAARAFRDGWDRLPPNAQGALVATVFVRGASMTGAMRAEMRQLRDECVPAADVQCIAAAHLAMCQRFAGRQDAAGLCNRFRATAALAVQA